MEYAGYVRYLGVPGSTKGKACLVRGVRGFLRGFPEYVEYAGYVGYETL